MKNALIELKEFISDGLGNCDESVKITDVWLKINELIRAQPLEIGDKVKVTKCIHGHEFDIGEIVCIAEINQYDFLCENGEFWWWMCDDEFEKINE